MPRPGGRLSGGRGAHLALRVAFAVTGCVLLLGFAFIFGLLVGRVGKTGNGGTSAQQLGAYHVDRYPLQSAAAVAERYARLCLNARPSSANLRSAQLQALASGNVPNDCGWDGRGTISATDIAWTGQTDPMAQYGDHGRYLHMQAALGYRGALVQFVIPVYASNLRAGTGVRVAGVPGILPAGAAPSKPDAVAGGSGSDDTGLAQMLGADVLPGFFDAWATSSAPDLDRYRTTDATRNVRLGLAGMLSNPRVQSVSVPVPGSGLAATHTWKTGEAATVHTTVTWQLPSGAHMTAGYRLTMIRTSATATGWLVRDIAGGLPDTSLDSDAVSSMPTTLPSKSSIPATTRPPTNQHHHR